MEIKNRLVYRRGTNKPTIFSPKIFLRYLRYYPPQTDNMTLCKGGYPRGDPLYGGCTPMPEGGMWITIYPHPPSHLLTVRCG